MKDSIAQAATNPGRTLTELMSHPIAHPVIALVQEELFKAEEKHAPLNSAHEAYAVLLEEVEEFWAEVMKKRSERSPEAMKAELVQIAAMACRAVKDLRL